MYVQYMHYALIMCSHIYDIYFNIVRTYTRTQMSDHMHAPPHISGKEHVHTRACTHAFVISNYYMGKSILICSQCNGN